MFVFYSCCHVDEESVEEILSQISHLSLATARQENTFVWKAGNVCKVGQALKKSPEKPTGSQKIQCRPNKGNYATLIELN